MHRHSLSPSSQSRWQLIAVRHAVVPVDAHRLCATPGGGFLALPASGVVPPSRTVFAPASRSARVTAASTGGEAASTTAVPASIGGGAWATTAASMGTALPFATVVLPRPNATTATAAINASTPIAPIKRPVRERVAGTSSSVGACVGAGAACGVLDIVTAAAGDDACESGGGLLAGCRAPGCGISGGPYSE